MELLDSLKFVQGAVSTRDFVPEMKHFLIKDGRAQAYNGVISLSSPISLNITCLPRAVPLVAAIKNCSDVVSLSMATGGRLKIQSGAFEANIECLEEQESALIHTAPSGTLIDIDGAAVLDAVSKLLPFIGNDASRPWVNGILFRDRSAFATNNVCLAEYWIGTELPFVANVPMAAIKELVRIKDTPLKVQIDENSITFHYSDSRWIKSALYETTWPDLTKILDKPSTQRPVPPELFPALETVKPFTDKQGLIHFIEGMVRTSPEGNIGASCQVEGLHGEGIYNLGMLSLLDGIAKTIDFELYPEPLLFYGDRVRGAIIGYRP